MMAKFQVLKNGQQKVQPEELRKLGNKELKIAWSDGHASVYGFRFLRQSCQCALCVDERTSKPILAREGVAENLEGLKVRLVGQYACSIDFSDGHSTGIYDFGFLRKICPCQICSLSRSVNVD
jgi:DUF971 family protein